MVKRLLPYLIGLVSGIALFGLLIFVTAQPRGEAIVLQPVPTQSPLLVDVSGAVHAPGVYTLPPGSRVQDAITLAGGLLDEADANALNMAARVRDGQKILVPIVMVAEIQAAAQPATSYPIDLNSASLEELDSLPGIGPTRALDILAYREDHNGFKSIDELMEVEGIGETTFHRIKDLVVVETGP